MRKATLLTAFAAAALAAAIASPAAAQIFDVTVRGGDAIFLAGRTDVVVPPASDPWTGPGTYLARHPRPTPEEIQETHPPWIPVVGGDVVRVLDPAIGGINFFNGYGPPFYGPGGNSLAGSDLLPLDGISGYKGPEGPLTGVFLDGSIPDTGPPPPTLDFTPSGLGTAFSTLSPLLRQVFYIGDGVTGPTFKTFIAPAGATRLFLGIPDGFGFDGHPGAYDDNDGAYRVRVGVNRMPDIPEPGPLALLVGAAAGMAAFARRRR